MSRDAQMRSVDPEKPSPHHPASGRIDDHAIDDFEDPNLDIIAFVTVTDEDSPYPEVTSAVANADDSTMPASTFRAWVVGLIWVIITSGVNQFFYFRYPSVAIDTTVPLLLTFPMCKLWARYLPNVSLFGISLNPGPFTIKEHVLVTIMASVGTRTAYATSVIAVQRVFYKQHPSFAYQWLLIMSTQLIGFSLGGICKRFLVAPPSMIWPQNLATAALFNTLHAQETSGSHSHDGISRQRFFTYAFIGYIFYNILPSYLFTALSSFCWVCWIALNNVKINQLFGVTHGMAMGILTFVQISQTALSWGVIGPQRIFSNGRLYRGLMFFFFVGVIVPLFQRVMHKKFKMNFLKHVNFPVIFLSTSFMPPATPLNYIPFVIVCFAFNYIIRRRHFGSWSKYNYVLSGALDAGYAMGMIIIFFALEYPKNGTIGLNTTQEWWGNVVYANTADFKGVPYKMVPEGGTFGPSSW